MSSEKHKRVARRFAEEFIGQGKTKLAGELFTDDYINYMPGSPEPLRGREQEVTLVEGWRTGFPDYTFEVLDLIGEGDRVAARTRFRGTHQGTFMGIAATGKPVAVEVQNFMTFRDGRIAVNRPAFDTMSMLEQLGVVPAPGQ